MTIDTNRFEKLRKELPSPVKILGAAKKKTLQDVQEVIKAGIDFIGENYVQEAEQKYHTTVAVPLHFIGHLQKNKVKRAVDLFDCIETADSFALAQEIDKRCPDRKKPFPVLIQVNIGNEPQKSGVAPENVLELAQQISSLSNVKLQGLMCIAPIEENSEKTRQHYRAMKDLFDMLNANNITITELSMGMSHDYKIAIEEGATMVRLGTTIFGPRH